MNFINLFLRKVKQFYVNFLSWYKKLNKEQQKKFIFIVIFIIFAIFVFAMIFNLDDKNNSIDNEMTENREHQNDSINNSVIQVDFVNSENFEKALNEGKDVINKTVVFDVIEYKPNSALGINCWSGEHLNFISSNELNVEKGYYVLGKVLKVTKTLGGSWKIEYEVLDTYKNKPSIKEKQDKENINIDKNEDNTPNTELEDKKNIVIMIVPVEDYIGKDYTELKTELESYGVTNIVIESVKTKDSNNINNSIKEFTINGETYKPFDEFKKDDEFKIVYWEYEKSTSEYELAFIRDMSNYDLYYMFDTDTKKVVFFGTNDTYIEKGTYTGEFSTGVKINWSHGEWTEKFVNKSNSSKATLTDGNGFEWEYEKCEVSKAQKVLDSLK